MVAVMIISGIAFILALVCLFILIGQRNSFKNFLELEKKLEGITEELEAKKITEQIKELKNITDSLEKKTERDSKRIEGFINSLNSIGYRIIEQTERYIGIIKNLVRGEKLAEEIPEPKPLPADLSAEAQGAEEEGPPGTEEKEEAEVPQKEKSLVDEDSSDSAVFDGVT